MLPCARTSVPRPSRSFSSFPWSRARSSAALDGHHEHGGQLPRLRLRFLPPYGTLSIGTTQNWVALLVYVVVMLLVARVVVAPRKLARPKRAAGGDAMRRVFELSELLVQDDQPVDLLRHHRPGGHRRSSTSPASPCSSWRTDVSRRRSARRAAFQGRTSPARPPIGRAHDHSLGRGLDERACARSRCPPRAGPSESSSFAMCQCPSPIKRSSSLSPTTPLWRWSGPNCANKPCVRSSSRKSTDLRQALMGAVSHDLRTPLATIKVASSTLVQPCELIEREGRTRAPRTH